MKRPPTRMMGAKEGKEEEEAKQQLLVNRVHNRRVSRPWHRTNSGGASGQRLLVWCGSSVVWCYTTSASIVCKEGTLVGFSAENSSVKFISMHSFD